MKLCVKSPSKPHGLAAYPHTLKSGLRPPAGAYPHTKISVGRYHTLTPTYSERPVREMLVGFRQIRQLFLHPPIRTPFRAEPFGSELASSSSYRHKKASAVKSAAGYGTQGPQEAKGPQNEWSDRFRRGLG